jgi:hypothetical protein
MKKIYVILTIAAFVGLGGCKKFLDVNENPNAPQVVEANLYLSPMLHWMVTSPTFDARFVGRYTQNWTIITTANTWDRQGYDPASDNGGQVFRDVYWSLGQNLVDMNNLAEKQQRWDLLGVGQILKAWGWLAVTDLHGEVPIKQAFEDRTAFDYDTQEFAYQEVLRLLNLAIANLKRTDGAVNEGYLAKTDVIYKGKAAMWVKFANGLKAMVLNHYSNKPGLYKADEIITAVDASIGDADIEQPLLAYTGTANDDINFFAGARDNLTNYRQTSFILRLMDGTHFSGVVDPRMSRMLSPSPDGQYRGLTIGAGVGALTAAQQPNNFWGYTTLALSIRTPARYIFSTKSKMPAFTYSQLQFVKAEAAYRKGDKTVALQAYKNGISAHFNFVNARNSDDGQTPTQILSSEKDAYMASTAVVPLNANDLTLTHIMLQKYIAQWGYGHIEQWMDLRRYHYLDLDPETGAQVFAGFVPPTSLYPDNGGKLVYRIRPRYNSEYVWNKEALEKIGGLATDYHTKEMWITLPQ